jgi:hypothetical protein
LNTEREPFSRFDSAPLGREESAEKLTSSGILPILHNEEAGMTREKLHLQLAQVQVSMRKIREILRKKTWVNTFSMYD